MGWLTEEWGGEHEGYVIALITREDTLPGSGVYRALGGPNDRHEPEIERLGAECTCGWRSPRWAPLRRAWMSRDGSERFALEWAPFSPIVSPDDEERAYQEWKRHVAEMSAREGDERTEEYPALHVVPASARQSDDPAHHTCALLEEPRCWLKRLPEEDGQRISTQPCNDYRTFCIAPGYCWCGHHEIQHVGRKAAPEEEPVYCFTCTHKPVRATRAIWVHKPDAGRCCYVSFCEACARRQRDEKRPASCPGCRDRVRVDIAVADSWADPS